jgi:hypothetical protein
LVVKTPPAGLYKVRFIHECQVPFDVILFWFGASSNNDLFYSLRYSFDEKHSYNF